MDTILWDTTGDGKFDTVLHDSTGQGWMDVAFEVRQVDDGDEDRVVSGARARNPQASEFWLVPKDVSRSFGHGMVGRRRSSGRRPWV